MLPRKLPCPSRDPYLAGPALEHAHVGEAIGVAGDDLGIGPSLAVVVGKGDGELLAVPACRHVGVVPGPARAVALALGVEPVPRQEEAAAGQPGHVSGGAAGVDCGWAVLEPVEAVVLGDGLPEVVPVGPDKHPEAAVAQLDEGRLVGAVVVSVTAKVDDVAHLPGLAVVAGDVGGGHVAAGVVPELLDGDDNLAAARLDHGDQGSVEPLHDHLAVGPRPPLVRAPHGPDVAADVLCGPARVVVPEPEEVAVVDVDQDDDAALGAEEQPRGGYSGAPSVVYRLRRRPGLAVVVGPAHRAVLDGKQGAVVQLYERTYDPFRQVQDGAPGGYPSACRRPVHVGLLLSDGYPAGVSGTVPGPGPPGLPPACRS